MKNRSLKTPNAAVWVDCGKTPLLTGALKQAMSYLNHFRIRPEGGINTPFLMFLLYQRAEDEQGHDNGM